MSRMLPVPHRILTHSARRLKQAPHPQQLLLVFRNQHTKPSQDGSTRFRKLPIYTTSALALALLSYGIYSFTTPSTPSTPPPFLDTRRFTPYALISKQSFSSTSSIYTLRPGTEPSSDPYAHLWTKGIWSVEFKQPQLQIARSYTPLPPPLPTITEENVYVPGDLRFLIRKEWKGEVSGYLDRLRIGAIVDIRGPRVEFEIPGGVEEVSFLAGGTGIAPAMQVVCSLLEERKVEGEAPRIRILWANRRREDCAGAPRAEKKRGWSLWPSETVAGQTEVPNRIVKELQELERRYDGRVKVEYMVDEEGRFIGKADILKITGGSSNSDSRTNFARPGKRLLFISGPEGFVEFYAGPREVENGKLGQGRVGGVLGALKLDDWTVVKL